MKDMREIKNGLVKKGLVFCLAGVLAFGMMACGGKDKKDGTKAEVKTEAGKTTEKTKDSTGTASSAQPKTNVENDKTADKTKGSTGTASSDKLADKKQDAAKTEDKDAQKGKTGTESKQEDKTQNTQKKTGNSAKN